MPLCANDIYASSPMRGLLADEAAALTPDLQRCAGSYALQISAAAGVMPPALPMLRCWVRLDIAAGRYIGDLHGLSDEPLPFGADSFSLVLLRHAIEAAPSGRQLLQEAARVLEPGGVLALTGMHPLSGWLPWWLWRNRAHGFSLKTPLGLEPWLHQAELTVERVQRIGRPWPDPRNTAGSGGLLGGGYLVIARKRRSAMLPIRLVPKAVSHPVDAGLAPGARRSAA